MEIVDVFESNLEVEMAKLRSYIDRYPLVTLVSHGRRRTGAGRDHQEGKGNELGAGLHTARVAD